MVKTIIDLLDKSWVIFYTELPIVCVKFISNLKAKSQ